jgi:PBS lyase HEAT-like repeat
MRIFLKAPNRIQAAGSLLGIASLLTCSPGLHAQVSDVRMASSGRISAASLADASRGFGTEGLDNLSFFVNAQAETLMDAWVSYSSLTCTTISTGIWTVGTQPTKGINTFGIINGTLANGDCPGVIFSFGAIYYTWTDPGTGAATTDSFVATWTAPGFQTVDNVAITLIAPTNFVQVGPGLKQPNGVLRFNYAWESTTGALADLSRCEVGESVAYPGAADPYVWPSPPYDNSTSNPTIVWVVASAGTAQDDHAPGTFLAPYAANTFTAMQQYRYRCGGLSTITFPAWNNVAIKRTVRDATGQGCWRYRITKTGASNTIPRLPGVPVGTCVTLAEEGPMLSVSQFSGAGESIQLEVQARRATWSLHEPIQVDLVVVNNGQRATIVDLGRNRNANLALTIVDPAGRTWRRALSRDGFGTLGEVSLEAGSRHEQPLLLDEWFDFRAEGTYRVKVVLLDPADPGKQPQMSSRPSADFVIEIRPRDQALLAQLAQSLADKAIGTGAVADRVDAAKALSFIRDPEAISSLVRVLEHGKMVEFYAVDGLARVGTPEAISALQRAESHPDTDVRARAKRHLGALGHRR